MAAPCAFELWLEKRLEALGLDADVYGGYIRGVLREAECDAERLEGLMGALAAGESDEEILQEVCKEIVERWSETQNTGTNEKKEDEVQAITNIIEKQAQIVMKPKEVSKEETLQKAALLAQYAEVTDEEDEIDAQDDRGAAAVTATSEKSLFKNTNLEDVINARKLEREHLRDESQRKKEQDKLQREKDKLTKQERKEKEKKRTQKGERKR
ncbi:coiled-coil domain-containing protein 43 [Varanus komodoensis]|uniref:Coiled-coil domain-containing protein 43 n=1 Tax=Varanus komodoensis TaxID=61221 RepID=A0A8D2LPC6_VARKO|nr:coiled-coil domain-containing protein 43 [Varanus komodoensis]